MKNTFGNSICVTLFGESHGESIGAIIDGIAPGIDIDQDFINEKLSQRRPWGKISTPRQETDCFEVHSGVFCGKTTGTPICIIIPNNDTKSKDYNELKNKARPSHADFTAQCKYHGFQDYRGGGHFSGRITAALVAAGAIIMSALNQKGIYIGTHIKSIGTICDRDILGLDDVKTASQKLFAVLDSDAEQKMMAEIEDAFNNQDSVGGVLETMVCGMPCGVGEPWFDTVEGVLSHALFSVPAVKGVEFGLGFDITKLRGSKANDPFKMEDGKVSTVTNNNGGINGGITNGMPIVYRTAIKPTPTISQEQNTVDFKEKADAVLKAGGRHDPCIVHRARAVVDAVSAIALADLLCCRFGTDWLAK